MASLLGQKSIPIVCESIGASIRDERQAQGLSLLQLSDRAGIEVERLKSFEEGEGEAMVTEIVDLAYALEVAPAYFFVKLTKSFKRDP